MIKVTKIKSCVMTDKPKAGRPVSGNVKTAAERMRAYRQGGNAPTAIEESIIKDLQHQINILTLELKSITNHRDGLLERVKQLEASHKRDVTENRELKYRIIIIGTAVTLKIIVTLRYYVKSIC